MRYSDKKIGQQIAGYKVEMCKSKTTIKTMLLPSFKKDPNGYGDVVPEVKLTGSLDDHVCNVWIQSVKAS